MWLIEFCSTKTGYLQRFARDDIALEKKWWQTSRPAIVQVGADEIEKSTCQRLTGINVDDLKLAAQSELAVALDNPGSDP